MIHARMTALASGLILTLGLSPSALAERGESSHLRPPTFSDLDVDRNGVLDLGEVQGRTPMYGVWDEVDTNRDNVIEPAEFAAYEAAPGKDAAAAREAPEVPTEGTPGRDDSPTWSALDINGDGVLSKAEAAGRDGLLSQFYWADRNGDGMIERSEFAAFEKAYPAGVPSVSAPPDTKEIEQPMR